MTQEDESPNASEGPYGSEELLAVLVVGLGDETQARETLEGIIQQALSGRALKAISEEALASRSGLLPPLWDHHEMQGFPDQLLIGLVIATLPLSLAA